MVPCAYGVFRADFQRLIGVDIRQRQDVPD
jgi:hypothetical protein